MKFIGQYIQKFIARFKNDVFLEDVSSGTIASGGNLGLDSNNKIVKANVPTTHDAVTLAGSLDYITLSGQEITRNAIDLAADVTGTLPVANGGTGVTSLGSIDISSLNNDSGFTSNTGDITSMALSGLNSGGGSTTLTVSSGDGTFQFMGGEGISVSLSTLSTNFYRLTLDGEDASDSNKGVAKFHSDNFDVSSGSVTIKSGGIDLADEVTGTLPVGNGGTGATTLTSNSILTGNGTSAIQAEAGLTYDSETLNVGNDDDGSAIIARKPHADGNGGSFQVQGGNATSGQTNKDGGDLFIIAGKGTGSGTPGTIKFLVPTAFGAGLADTTLQSTQTPITIDSSGLNLITGFPIHLGATDTSLSRLSAGVLGVEGNKVLMEESEVVNIGDDDNGIAQIKRLRHTDDEGGDLYVRGGDATGTDKAGGDLQLFGGRATGNGTGGGVIIQAGETNASSGTTLRGANTIASFRADGDTLLTGNLIFEGPTPDVNETTFSITDPTADRTITVPDASGTMAFLDSDITGNAAGLTASTSNSIGVGTIELGHASDCTIARGSSGKVRIEGEHVVTTLTELFGSGASGETLATRIARRTLTTAEMNDLHNTPIQIVPAPGSNIVALPTGGMIRVDRASTNSGTGSLEFHYNGVTPAYGTTSLIHFRRFNNGKTTDTVYNIVPNSGGVTTGTTLTDDVNSAIEVSLTTAATTDCFTSVDIYLTYQLIKIA